MGDWHVASLGHIIIILIPSQPVFAFNLINFGFIWLGLTPKIVFAFSP